MRGDFPRFVIELGRVGRILFPADYARWILCLLRSWPEIFRERSLGPADRLFGETFRVRFGPGYLNFSQTPLGLAREIFGQHCYARPEELQNTARILDLGANAGVFSVYALACAPRAQVHAVEAQPGLMAVLQNNVAQNGYAQRHHAETAVVGGAWDSWTRNLMNSHPEVPVFDPEAFFRKNGDMDFCKCDIEGAEFPLLRDHPRWLSRIRCLALEYHGTPGEGDELAEILFRQDFKVSRLSHGTLGYLKATRK